MPKWTDKPWERQKGESEKAYEAFAAYRDLGEKRTIVAVAEKLQKSDSLIRRWKDRWNWKERVRAYDNDLEKEARAKAVKDRKDMTARHIGIAMQLQKKALEALQGLSVEDMTPKDIKEYIKMATDLERLNRTLEEDESKGGEAGASLADTIIEAYRKRRGEDDA
ncbi:hypothetical protein EI53_01269 [Fusobacterium naviforme]|nr:hypothetical protein F7P78_06340 [Fusobacterium naviforme]PSL10207.1 hypothetical protein EI53_01269 [Fusobacterium naviforme]STO27617.1 Uncharacterised protein [Fusobacterium naviforme]